jgi:hypothetical protein
MTLKEKMKVEIMNLPIMDEVIDYIGKELEYVADDFAIGFAKWMYDYKGDINKVEELLKIYKKEKGL